VEADIVRHSSIAEALKPFVTDTVELINDMHNKVGAGPAAAPCSTAALWLAHCAHIEPPAQPVVQQREMALLQGGLCNAAPRSAGGQHGQCAASRKPRSAAAVLAARH
jgi:hypothetical protein